MLPYGLLALVAWVALVAARSFVLSHLAAIPLALQAPLARALAALPSPRLLLPAPHRVVSLVALPASFFSALKGSKSSSTELLSVSMMAAHSAHERAHHALDVFDNLLRLSSPDGPSSVALEPVAIWELSAAVKYSSALEDRDFLAEQLGELGDLSRTVKDDITSLNAQGINAFTFIVCAPFAHSFLCLTWLTPLPPPDQERLFPPRDAPLVLLRLEQARLGQRTPRL